MNFTARAAGLAFLVYIGVGIGSLALNQMAAGAGGDTAERIAAMSENVRLIRYATLLDLVCAFCALILGATLFALTSAQGMSAAAFALGCRFVEAMLIAGSLSGGLAVVRLYGNAGGSAEGIDVLASYVLRNQVALTSTFFAAGSLVFSWLLLRGRIIPAALAWLGVLASLALLIVMPLQLVGLANDPRLTWAWAPMLLFEVPLGLWLIVRGAPRASQSC